MKRSDIPSLDDLRAFASVARHGSIRGAADELALTHGAVSRRVAKLQRDLGLRLIEADGRGIAVTPAGKELGTSTVRAFAIISDTLASLQAGEDDGAVVISCERSIAMRWLIPRLSQFQDEHPEVRVHLSVGGGAFDFATEGTTLALRRMDFAVAPDLDVTYLADERMGPVMQAEMVAEFRAGHFIGLGSKTRPNAWDEWIRLNPDAPPPKELRLFDHHFLMAEAAASGLGVALAPQFVVMDDIDRNRLVAPFGFIADGSHYGLIQKKSDLQNTAAQKLAKWIRDEVSASQP
ncbi:DNA-binding transcriptional regulator, LysR family [Epibacterium ulvae]|uniref:DNA-binding transcriptional regulator, LysR family n=1 Tax=Epibacterium ulvae TaxID=1156985 RepID=A0A1G5QJE2_9RHOB|nr:LysR family transcriptional regulator [Epibacterium ulvae]SCZ61289.1 DNA-binding transcriptional regulator, LysR family [Epibacterium ulvae]